MVLPRREFAPITVTRGGRDHVTLVSDRRIRLLEFGLIRRVAVLRDDGRQTHVPRHSATPPGAPSPLADQAAVTTPRLSVAPSSSPSPRRLWIALALIVAIGAVALAFIAGGTRPHPTTPARTAVTIIATPASLVVTPPPVAPALPAVTPPTSVAFIDAAGAPTAQRTPLARPSRAPSRPAQATRPVVRERVPVE